jgi:hypothetical protein
MMMLGLRVGLPAHSERDGLNRARFFLLVLTWVWRRIAGHLAFALEGCSPLGAGKAPSRHTDGMMRIALLSLVVEHLADSTFGNDDIPPPGKSLTYPPAPNAGPGDGVGLLSVALSLYARAAFGFHGNG